MLLGQVPAMDGLGSVTARELDTWIASTLEPSTTFRTQVKQTVKQICDFFKEQCFEDIRVHKTVKGGSAGKGTALKNNSDADVVLFLSCFSSYQEQLHRRAEILTLIEERLECCRQTLTFTVDISKPQRKGPPDSPPRSLSLTLSSKLYPESIEVDVLPAYDALGQVTNDAKPADDVYIRLLNAHSGPGEFSPCFTELQKKFVKRCPAKLKNLLRLVKYWYKEVLKPRYPNTQLPPKYALELLTIYAWEQGTDASEGFDMAVGFRTVLQLLHRHQEIIIYWEKYYSLQDSQVGTHVKKLLLSSRPVILDPADPTGILGKGKNWEVVANEAARCCCLLPCVASVQPWDVQPARPVTVEIRALTGKSLTRTVSLDTTILNLKEEIAQQWSIPPYQQRLGQQKPGQALCILQDSKTLATCEIFCSTTLMLLHTETQEMQVLVKDDKNCTTTYTVRPTDTVRQLKEQICTLRGVSADQQRLTFGSRELEDRHTLGHYGIQSKSVIYLLLRLRGGAGPRRPPFPAPLRS
ncbi:2'-5'-oligoadenylate synthase 1-like [Dromaius novaehollandiae]|uniref:2'-5'-oligoadenylate synthase 1-like n=1 Tax=Dromaius novaehollandiae TaxID=8790 RepID=UPI00311F91E9